MKLGVMAVLGILMVGSMGGCQTLSRTPAEEWNNIVHAQDTNMKQIPEDINYILLLDRPSWLSRKPIPWH